MAHPELARIYGSTLVAGEHESITFTELSNVLIQEMSAVLITALCPDQRQALQLAEGIYFAYIGRLFTWPRNAASNGPKLKQDLQRTVATICTQQELTP